MQDTSRKCWLTPNAERQEGSFGQAGVYAVQPIAQDECIWAWLEPVLSIPPIHSFSHSTGQLIYVYLSCGELGGDCFHHSCDPNAGFRSVTELVAMREILPTEQITFDFAMCLPFNFGRLECNCGALTCRKIVTGSDWEWPGIQQRYQGYFQPFIAEKISRLEQVRLDLTV